MMQKKFKKYKLNDYVTIQVIAYTEQMMTAKFWFTGKGFDGTHHHLHQEVDVVTAGIFEAYNAGEKYKVYPGQAVIVSSDKEHNMECLTPIGEMISIWTSARQDIIEKYTELED